MPTITHGDTETRAVRIPLACWKAVRREAFEREVPAVQVVAEAIRAYLRMNGEEPKPKRKTA